MESSCHHCGAPVEPGVLFCKQCGAPQIRVAVEPTEAPGPVISPSGAPDLERAPHEPARPSALERSPARRATVLGGLLEGALAVFGWGIIGIPLGAFFSVAFYRRRTSRAGLSSALGARLGLISGAIGFVIFAVVGSLGLLLSNDGGGLREEVMKQLEQTAAQYPAQAQQALNYLKSAQGWGLIVALSTIFTLITFLLLSTIGGAVGGAILSKKDPGKF